MTWQAQAERAERLDNFRAVVGSGRPYGQSRTVYEGDEVLQMLAREAIDLGFPWWAPWYGYDPDSCPLCGYYRHDNARLVQSAVHYIDKGDGRIGQRGGPVTLDVTCYGDGYPAALRRRRVPALTRRTS